MTVGRGPPLAELAPLAGDALVMGAIYALFALGYALIFGLFGVLNLAHAAVFTGAALVVWWLVAVAQAPLAIALPLVILVAGACGVIVERLAVAPFRGRPASRLHPLVASLAVALMINALAAGLVGEDVRIAATPARLPGLLALGPHGLDWLKLLSLVVVISLLALTQWAFRRSRYGLAARAVGENPRVASLLGIDIGRTVAQTFFLAAALGGAAGALYGLGLPSAGVGLHEPLELRGLAIIVLGGMGSVPGAIIGGFALALIETYSASFLAAPYRDVAAFVLIFLVLTLRPSGLLGQEPVREG